jgi:hypothetical protein
MKARKTLPNDPLPTSSDRYRSREDLARAGNPKEYDAAVVRGRAEADEQIKSNQAELWDYGTIIRLDNIDRETGLFYTGFGCVVDDQIIGRVEGHNARIEEYIRSHGLPKNSLKPWEKELFGLKEYFENRKLSEKPIRLMVGAPEARSPDGNHVVRLVKVPEKVPPPRKDSELRVPPDPRVDEAARILLEKDYITVQTPYFAVGDPGDKANLMYCFWRDIEPELVWGPKGSWFAVIKGRMTKDGPADYEAIDLRVKRRIREESGTLKEFMEKLDAERRTSQEIGKSPPTPK